MACAVFSICLYMCLWMWMCRNNARRSCLPKHPWTDFINLIMPQTDAVMTGWVGARALSAAMTTEEQWRCHIFFCIFNAFVTLHVIHLYVICTSFNSVHNSSAELWFFPEKERLLNTCCFWLLWNVSSVQFLVLNDYKSLVFFALRPLVFTRGAAASGVDSF